MPRPLAILLAYLGVLLILGVVLYFVVTTAILQISTIVHQATFWFKPDSSGKSPLLQFLLRIGVTNDQITASEQQLLSGLSNLAGSLAGGMLPLLSGVASGLLNILLTVVVSIYLLVDGNHALRALRQAAP